MERLFLNFYEAWQTYVRAGFKNPKLEAFKRNLDMADHAVQAGGFTHDQYMEWKVRNGL